MLLIISSGLDIKIDTLIELIIILAGLAFTYGRFSSRLKSLEELINQFREDYRILIIEKYDHEKRISQLESNVNFIHSAGCERRRDSTGCDLRGESRENL